MIYRYPAARRGIRVFALFLFFCFLVNSLLAQSPNITSFSPTVGTTGTIVSINGSGFTGVTAVTFGRVSATSFIVHSDTLITADVGSGASGLVEVGGPHGYDSLAGFVFLTPAPPHINSFSPDSGRTGTVVTINGTHFTGTTRVFFSTTPAASFTVASDTVIKATVGSGSSGSILVGNPFGLGSKAGFIYIPTPVPTHITSFSPDSAAAGMTVRIHGVSFTGTTFVGFGGVSASRFTVVADTVISAVVGNGSSGAVVVSGSKGTDSLTGFTYLAPLVIDTPHILSFTPDSAAAGTVVTITGTHFSGITRVSFGGMPAASFTVISDSVLHARVGPGSSGFVAVANANGSDSLAGFTYILPVAPTHIYYFTPTSATTGTTVYIHGVSFTGTTFVGFGGVSAQSFIVAADSLITAVVGDGASGAVVVSGAHGADSLAGFVFIDSTDSTGSTGSTPSAHGLLLKEYPNPATSMLYVTVPNTTASSKLMLTDMNGKVVRTIYVAPNATTVLVNVSGLVMGAYKLVWSDGKHLANQTVLVVNE